MKKTGRNEPCPCGSGKKYKKCCINAPKLPQQGGRYVYTDLDELSNRVPDLIDQEKFAEAEDVCKQLMEQYPEQIDGLHRFAKLYEAQGERQKAAEYYRKAANFAILDGGFDRRTVESFQQKAEDLAG
jgi:tetratricopeptide (TPR) repeat protein